MPRQGLYNMAQRERTCAFQMQSTELDAKVTILYDRITVPPTLGISTFYYYLDFYYYYYFCVVNISIDLPSSHAVLCCHSPAVLNACI